MKSYPKLDSDSFGACGTCGSTWHIFCDNPKVLLCCFVATFVLKKKQVLLHIAVTPPHRMSNEKRRQNIGVKGPYLHSYIGTVSMKDISPLIKSSVVTTSINSAGSWAFFLCAVPLSTSAGTGLIRIHNLCRTYITVYED